MNNRVEHKEYCLGHFSHDKKCGKPISIINKEMDDFVRSKYFHALKTHALKTVENPIEK